MKRYRIHLSMTILAAALMLHSHPCGAQSGYGCPIQIRHIKWQTAGPGFSPSKHRGLAVHLQYTNVTAEVRREVAFDSTTSYRERGAIGQSMLENANKTPVAATAPPGKWKTAEIDIGLGEPEQIRLRLADVTFSSGRH